MATNRTSPGSRTTRWLDVALWALTVVCVALTFWFSFFEAPPGADAFTGADKVGHGLAYFASTLSFLFAAVWRPGRGDGRWPRLGMWFPAGAAAFGVVIELLQGLTPNRTPEVRDVLAEAVGAVLALLLHGLVRWWSVERARRRVPDDPAPAPGGGGNPRGARPRRRAPGPGGPKPTAFGTSS